MNKSAKAGLSKRLEAGYPFVLDKIDDKQKIAVCEYLLGALVAGKTLIIRYQGDKCTIKRVQSISYCEENGRFVDEEKIANMLCDGAEIRIKN